MDLTTGEVNTEKADDYRSNLSSENLAKIKRLVATWQGRRTGGSITRDNPVMNEALLKTCKLLDVAALEKIPDDPYWVTFSEEGDVIFWATYEYKNLDVGDKTTWTLFAMNLKTSKVSEPISLGTSKPVDVWTVSLTDEVLAPHD